MSINPDLPKDSPYAIRRELLRPNLNTFIFDLDGVIINSEPLHLQMANDILEPHGIEIPWLDYEPFIGGKDIDFYRYVQQLAPLKLTAEELVADYKHRLDVYFNEAVSVPIIPDIVNLVKCLYSEGWRLAVASSSSHVNIRHVLRAAGLIDYFPVQVSGEDVRNGKPAPDIYLEAVAQLGATAAESVAIEDSCAGTISASTAGLYTIGFQHAGSGKQDLSQADLIIDRIGKLLQRK